VLRAILKAREALDAVRVYPLSDRGVHAIPVARAAFFATRLSPAPVLRIVRFADFTTFVVLDFVRLAILFPLLRYLVGPGPRPLCEAVVHSNPHHHGCGFRIWKLSRKGAGLVRLLPPVLRVVEMTGSHRHTHNAPAATQRVCAELVPTATSLGQDRGRPTVLGKGTPRQNWLTGSYARPRG
jgi:hypothetical protein